jgi:hypothetical protein
LPALEHTIVYEWKITVTRLYKDIPIATQCGNFIPAVNTCKW